jgi:hypothetical protein
MLAGATAGVDAVVVPCHESHCGIAVFVLLQVGLIEPSGGSAMIGGHDITKEMDDIYSLMGVCPQHDLLWETLTGAEADAVSKLLNVVFNYFDFFVNMDWSVVVLRERSIVVLLGLPPMLEH